MISVIQPKFIFKLKVNKEHLSSQMAKEPQGNASEVPSIGYQRESKREDLDRLSKIKNLRFWCLTCCIVCKWGDETTEHKTENINQETVFKEDTQNTLEHLHGKTNFAKWGITFYYLFTNIKL